MKRSTIVVLLATSLTFVLAGAVSWNWASKKFTAAEAAFQSDADAKRIADVHKIAAMLEEYKLNVGHYPYFDRPQDPPYGKRVYMVVVAQRRAEEELRRHTAPFTLDVDTRYAKDLIPVLSEGLKRSTRLPVDPQKVATTAHNAYYIYFLDDDTYLVTAFIHSPFIYAVELSPGVNLYAVSSGPIGAFLSGVGIRPREFYSIPQDELLRANVAGARSDAIFEPRGAAWVDGREH